MLNINYIISIFVLIGMLTIYNNIQNDDEKKCQFKNTNNI